MEKITKTNSHKSLASKKLSYLSILISTLLLLSGCGTLIEHEGSTYRYITDSVSWSEAKALAEQEGGHLATFSSPEEFAAVEYYLPTGQIFWIGLSDAEQEGQWKWIDGTRLDPRLPSNLEQDRGASAELRDYAHLTLNGFLASRADSGDLPRNVPVNPEWTAT